MNPAKDQYSTSVASHTCTTATLPGMANMLK